MAHLRTTSDGLGIEGQGQLASNRVLLVSDSADELEMYAEAFRFYGLPTVQACTAADAFRLASELAPAVIITDLRLSGSEDGLSFTRRVKAHKSTRAIPVVILTATELSAQGTRRVRAGCDLLLFKPCLPDALSRAATDLIQQRIR